jgi:predicted DNA binding CopG/RHH family protein
MIKIKKVKKVNIKPIPPFKSLEEEASFWDSHSVVDEINEGTLVGFHQANKTSTMTIRFAPKQIEVLKQKAFHLGVGPTTLVRMWVLDKLRDNARETKI